MMGRVTIKQAELNEMDWVNSKYDEINFAKSNFENEFIVIAKVGNEAAGLGRLVKIDDGNIELGGIYVFPEFRGIGAAEKIVSYLCDKNPSKESKIWCLPFVNLLKFYTKFGFEKYKNGEIPEEVITKFEWCNSGNEYDKEVILLCQNG